MSLVRLSPWNWFIDESAVHNTNVPAQAQRNANAHVTRLHDDIDTLFDQAVRGFFSPALANGVNTMFTPRLDLHTDEKQYTVTLELPGIDPAEVKISLHDDMLSISGEKKCEKQEEEKKGYSHCERVYGSFERVLSLPDDADVDSIVATTKNGVLTVVIPRKAPLKSEARQIAITHAE